MSKSVDFYLQRLITEAKGINPDINCSVGSDTYIRFQSTASIAWGLDKQKDWTVDQIFPTSQAKASLEHTAGDLGLTVTDLTTAEILTNILARLRNPPAGGKIGDYETWALEVSSTGSSLALTAAMFSSSTLSEFASAAAVASHTDTQAFSAATGDEGKHCIIDLGFSKSVFGMGIGTRGSRVCTFYVHSSDDGTTWTQRGTLVSTFWWAMKTFTAVEARYWKVTIAAVEELGESLEEEYNPYTCCGIELYTDESTIEKATTVDGQMDAYGAGTVLMVVEPSTLSMRFLESCRAYLYAKGPVSPRELWVETSSEIALDLRITITGTLSSESLFGIEVAQYFAGMGVGEMWIPAQILVYAVKYGATNAVVEMSTDNGTSWTTVTNVVTAGSKEKYVLDEVIVQ